MGTRASPHHEATGQVGMIDLYFLETTMGMDLIGAGLSYNWAGWRRLAKHLGSWGVDTMEMRFSNDGAPISRTTCLAVANAIEAHLDELDEDDRKWLQPHIKSWRQCLGCQQW
jgi:hypothetical protein